MMEAQLSRLSFMGLDVSESIKVALLIFSLDCCPEYWPVNSWITTLQKDLTN